MDFAPVFLFEGFLTNAIHPLLRVAGRRCGMAQERVGGKTPPPAERQESAQSFT